MTQAETMIAAARACLGTPFHHQGRLPGQGLDCIGLVIIALRAAGFMVQDRQDYARWPEGEALAAALVAHGAQALAIMQPGTVLLFMIAGQAQHVALATGETRMIHAYAPAGKVVETDINSVWQRRLVGLYQFGES